MESKLYKSLVFRRQNTLPNQVEKIVAQNKISECFLALSYIVHGKVEKASLVIDALEKTTDTRYCQEAKMLIASALRKDSEAISIASNLVQKYPDAIFAHYLLGYTSDTPRNALKHYRAILQFYPELDSVKLRIAERLTHLKEYTQALQYVKKCKPTIEKRLYQLLIPLNLKRYRIFLLIFAVLLAGITKANLIIWGGITVCIAVGIVISLMKYQGTLIANRLILLEIITTISWFSVWFFRQ